MTNLFQAQAAATEKMIALLPKRNNAFVNRARRAAYSHYVKVSTDLGFTPAQAERQWQDIWDVARLTLNSEEE